MTNKTELLSDVLESTTQSDLAREIGCDRRKVSDCAKRGHIVVTNSKGRRFLIPSMYREAFE